MDRRKFLFDLRNDKAVEYEVNRYKTLSEVTSYSLEKYNGNFSYPEARHLLSRTLFGANPVEIEEAASDGLEATLDKLLQINPISDAPLVISRNDSIPYGDTFIDAPVNQDVNKRLESMLSWWSMRFFKGDRDISEKLTLFWTNHYSIESSVVRDSRYLYRYYKLLHDNSLGNFRELTKSVTIDLAMLQYLNGAQNIVQAPNENYARELFELFSVGKGSQIEPGNYTNYTEKDILAAARCLTGWILNRRQSENQFEASYVDFLHDKDDKQFSLIFGNRVISNQGADEYKVLIDMIYESDKAAHYLAKKLYIYFVNDQIDDNVELGIIQPLAKIIFDNDYEVKPALRALLQSEHFFDVGLRGSMIKVPFEFMGDLIHKLEFDLSNSDFSREYRNYFELLVSASSVLEQTLSDPPSVAGWPAYYQEPMKYRMWLNSVTLPIRQRYSDALIAVGYRNRTNRDIISYDTIGYIEKYVDDPSNEYNIIRRLAEILYPIEISEERIEFFRGAIIPEGQPDYLWQFLWGQYQSDKDNETVKTQVDYLLKSLLLQMCASAEFHLN
ncbi:MAG: hypothetical protein Kapaf2KO_22300 [Candidatus Kapaibacteriales bacterium]